MIIRERFLVFPVRKNAEPVLVTFCEAGRLVYDLNIRLADGEADFHAFVDVSRFQGMELCIEAEGRPLEAVEQAASWDDRAPVCAQTRPLLHFAPRNGWNNDPNGLVYANGVYHMFFQYNPCDTAWGNMHWGHAVSEDLIHWQEKEIALYPDELGVMFSGSAIVDRDNQLGLKKGDTDVILLFYTAEPVNLLAKGKQTTQCLAYSTDNGETFHKHPSNPIVPTIVNGNRDPKVIRDEENNRWLMALYLDSDRYAILHSEDLLFWEKVQELHLEGDNECPDWYTLPADDGTLKTVIGGAHGCYQVGDLQDGRFVPTQPVKRLYLNEYCYAHQTYSGIPGRVVQTTWHRANVQECFSQELSFPCELSLVKRQEEYQLLCRPARELETMIRGWVSVSEQDYAAGETLHLPLELPSSVVVRPCGDAKLTFVAGDQQLVYDPAARTITAQGESYPLPDAATEEMQWILDRYTLKLHLCGGAAVLALPVRWTEQPELILSSPDAWQHNGIETAQLESPLS